MSLHIDDAAETSSTIGEPDYSAMSAQTVIERHVRCSSLSNSIFELIILPTEQCNFRCTYCYEDFEIGAMSQETIEAICALLDRRMPGLKHLHINYFGGEPLLGLKAIRMISGHAKMLSERIGNVFTSGITTNGYLLDRDTLEELVGLQCRNYQISLDGWGKVHDITRMRRNGKDTFERIWANLLEAKATSHDFEIGLRVHMMPGNRDSVLELISNINEQLGDERFEVIVKKVGNWGGKSDQHPEVYSDESLDFDRDYETIVGAVRNLSSVSASESAGNAPRINHASNYGVKMPEVCYASKANSLVIRANGRLNKCTVALSSKRNDIGHINADGSLSVDAEKLGPWLAGLGSLDAAYMACPASRVLSQFN